MKKLPQQLRDAFPKRPLDLHKYSAGTVTIVGGSVHFVHAPVIAGLGARAAGAGLVQLVVPDASRIAAGCLVPEATFTKQTPACVPPKADVTAIGMGLGTTQNAEMLLSRLLSGSAGRFVLDADALTILANWYARKSSPLPVTDGQSLVLTPHAGEAAACSHAAPTTSSPTASLPSGALSSATAPSLFSKAPAPSLERPASTTCSHAMPAIPSWPWAEWAISSPA